MVTPISGEPLGVREDDEASDVYFRLDLSSGNTSVEAYWPEWDDWLSAKVINVLEQEDGKTQIKIKWTADKSFSVVSSHWVQKLCEGRSTNTIPVWRFLSLA